MHVSLQWLCPLAHSSPTRQRPGWPGALGNRFSVLEVHLLWGVPCALSSRLLSKQARAMTSQLASYPARQSFSHPFRPATHAGQSRRKQCVFSWHVFSFPSQRSAPSDALDSRSPRTPDRGHRRNHVDKTQACKQASRQASK